MITLMETSVRLFTEKEAARYIGMSQSFLARARMVGDKDMPVFLKLGRAVRYRLSDLDAWLESRVRHSTNLLNKF
jgi:excisionase family DNA binding protein